MTLVDPPNLHLDFATGERLVTSSRKFVLIKKFK
jgi:hypothetical protein